MDRGTMLVRACGLLALVTAVLIGHTEAQIRRRRVTIPPLIYVEPSKRMAFREEESIELPCVASGEPDPEYYWHLNGAIFSPSGNDGRIARQPGKGTLIFARPIERDEGIYQCFATNKHGISASVKVDLRLGILKSFPSSARQRSHYPQIGMSLTLPCTPPQSYPPAEIFWATVAQSEGFTPIDLTDRVSIDPIGNLHFANVMQKDEQDGRQYVCIVQNKVMRRTQHGSYQIIRPRGGSVRRMPPQILWQSPITQVALRGDILKIKCIFSGSPTPRVTWSRQNGPMPSRKREESFGQELVIENVQFEDEGKYECQGINEEASVPIRRSFVLSVEAAPYWKQKPELVNAAEGTTAVFHCIAQGLPDPVIFWFIDGKPIATVAADKRRVVQKNSITIVNVTNDDAFVIQCNATNKHGYIWANAYLNVQTEPPFILEPPIDGQRVAEDQTVRLRCKVFGSPKPQIIWTKSGEQLTGGRFKVLEEGDLQITDVSLVDAGEYKCTATNRLDTVSDVGTLVVRRKTLIQTPPLDVMVYEGTEAKFTCTATTDPEEIDNLVIDWKKDGQIIDYRLAQRVFKNDMDNSLTISGTISLDTGKYSCIAHNGLDESEIRAQLVVQGRPDAPNNVRVKCYETSGIAEVEWQPGKENYAPILNFVVQFNTTFAPDTWINVPYSINQTDRKLDVKLSPWGNYTFRVLARNKIGISPPSDHTRNVCRTLEDVPDKNPENVIGEGDEPDNLVIYWTPMPRIEQNGKNFKYIVSWKKMNAPDAEEETDTVEISEAYHYLVSERVETYQPYEIYVKAKNAVGDARVSPKRVIGFSGEDVPTVAPYDLSLIDGSVTGTQASLQWTAVDPDPAQIRGFFRGYRIQFWKKKEGAEMMREVDYIVNQPKQYPRPRTKRDAGDLLEYRLSNLPPFANILLQVRVLNKYYVGPPSETITFTTLEGQPGPPAMFEVIARGSTHFELRWEQPEEPNGVLTGYTMSYQQITGLNLGRLQYRQPIDDPDQLRARLTGLQPETDYRIYLSAATSNGKGEPIFLDARTTHAGPPSAPTFEILDIGEDWAMVSWEPSRSGNPGSVFYIQYRARGEYNWEHSPEEVLAFTMKVDNLASGTTYQARAVSKNGAGEEAPAEWQTFTTGGIGPGRVDLKTAAWFYSIFACLLFIILFMIGFVCVKRFTDSWWEVKEAEIEEQVRQLQAEEAIRQLGIVNQYAVTGSQEVLNHSYGDPSADYYNNKPPLNGSFEEDDDAAAGFHKGYQPPAYTRPDAGYAPPQQHEYHDQPPHNGYQPPDTEYHQQPQAQHVGYHPPPDVYNYGPPVHIGSQPQAGHRGSPVEEADEAFVQDGQYHLQQGIGNQKKESPSFV